MCSKKEVENFLKKCLNLGSLVKQIIFGFIYKSLLL